MKVFVYYYNDSNLGDDLFLDCLVRRYPEHDFFIYSDCNALPINDSLISLANLKVSKINLLNKTFASQAKNYDALVLIGGSIFQDLDYSLYRGYIGRYLIFKKLLKLNKKVFVLGANLGPFNTLFGKVIFKHILKHVTHICVRDQYSFSLLDSWKIKNKHCAPDIIFGYNYQTKVQKKEELLGISILNTKLNPEVQQDYVLKMVEVINLYLSKNDTNIVRLFGFDGGHENDGFIIDKIIELVDQKDRVFKIEYNNEISISFFLDYFLECGFMITNRFHSMILSAKYNIPFFPIIYSKKTSNVLNDIGYKESSIEYSKIKNLNSDLLISSIVNRRLDFNLDKKIILDAEKHFFGLDNNL